MNEKKNTNVFTIFQKHDGKKATVERFDYGPFSWRRRHIFKNLYAMPVNDQVLVWFENDTMDFLSGNNCLLIKIAFYFCRFGFSFRYVVFLPHSLSDRPFVSDEINHPAKNSKYFTQCVSNRLFYMCDFSFLLLFQMFCG